MFGTKDGKPVDVIATEHTNIDGRIIAAGTIIRECPAQLAMEMAASGRVRLATEADHAAAAKAAKAAKAADQPAA